MSLLDCSDWLFQKIASKSIDFTTDMDNIGTYEADVWLKVDVI